MAGCRLASMRAAPGPVWGRSAWAEFGLDARNELMRWIDLKRRIFLRYTILTAILAGSYWDYISPWLQLLYCWGGSRAWQQRRIKGRRGGCEENCLFNLPGRLPCSCHIPVTPCRCAQCRGCVWGWIGSQERLVRGLLVTMRERINEIIIW